MKRSKCICLTALSALAITLLGVVFAFVGSRDVFVEAINNLMSLFPGHWYVVVVPGVLVLLLIADIVMKSLRKDKNVVSLFAILLNVLAFLLVIPSAYLELLDFSKQPESLVYVSGAVLIVIAFLALVVVGIMELFGKLPVKVVEEVDEVYDVEEEVDAPPTLGEVEFLDEEAEDEDDLEEGEEDDVPSKPLSKKAQAKADKKAKKEGGDKDYDRIYHIMKRAKDDRWIVKIAQSKKAIKIFDTQKEAIEFAEVLAGNNKGVVRVFASKGANKGRIII